MKVFILFFPFIVVTYQAYQLPLNRRILVARQGDPESNEPYVNDQFYEKLKKLVKKYNMLDDAVDPDPQTLLIPDVYKTSYLRSRGTTPLGPHVNGRITNPAANHLYPNPLPSRINNPALHQHNSNLAVSHFTNSGTHTRSLTNESAQLRQVAQADHEAQLLQQANAEQAARLARIDKEALSKLSEEDREILESKLSLTEREALLVKLEDGQLDDFLPRDENRFGVFSSVMSGFSGAAVQMGASAGGYIGGKLAGQLGAKLGAAAGAYLGAAAASRFVKKTKAESDVVSTIVSDDAPPPPNNGLKYTYGSFGAVKVHN